MQDVIGSSAYRASKNLILACLVWVGILAVIVSTSFLMNTFHMASERRDVLKTWQIIIFDIVLISGGLIISYFYVQMFSRSKRELRMGYTTAPYSREKVNILDARSGRLIRNANDKPLETRAELREALRRGTIGSPSDSNVDRSP